jgi:Uma2 family endonuclease
MSAVREAMSTGRKPYLTPAEYLAIERNSVIKHAYYAGEMFAMSAASEEHNLIGGNVLASIHQQLKRRPCKVYPGDMRVKIAGTGLYTYPDLSALCGPAEFEDSHVDTLLNPTLIVEVLSESTEAYDRGKKFEHYRKIPSFTEYVLVSQDHYHLERYSRQEDGRWLLSECSGLETSMELTSIGCTLAMADVYEKVELPA